MPSFSWQNSASDGRAPSRRSCTGRSHSTATPRDTFRRQQKIQHLPHQAKFCPHTLTIKCQHLQPTFGLGHSVAWSSLNFSDVVALGRVCHTFRDFCAFIQSIVITASESHVQSLTTAFPKMPHVHTLLVSHINIEENSIPFNVCPSTMH